jgi:hypothetical protein
VLDGLALVCLSEELSQSGLVALTSTTIRVCAELPSCCAGRGSKG